MITIRLLKGYVDTRCYNSSSATAEIESATQLVEPYNNLYGPFEFWTPNNKPFTGWYTTKLFSMTARAASADNQTLTITLSGHTEKYTFTMRRTDGMAVKAGDIVNGGRYALLFKDSDVFVLNAPVTIREMTYTDIAALKNSGKLVPGPRYLITDYATKYRQPYTNVIKETTLNEAVHGRHLYEQLTLTAISSNQFDPIVQSSDYPKDIIYYDFAIMYAKAEQQRVKGL